MFIVYLSYIKVRGWRDRGVVKKGLGGVGCALNCG
jgi:hypothetical protein